jgi:hypothetical protein
MKPLSLIVVVAAIGLSHPLSSIAAEMQLKVVHWCKDGSGRIGQRVDGCRFNEAEVDVSAPDPNAQVAFDRVSKAYDAAAHPVVAATPVQAQAQPPDARRERSDEEVMHYGRMKLLRTFAFMVAGALVFKLLLRRSLLVGALVGFLVELVLVGAAVMN